MSLPTPPTPEPIFSPTRPPPPTALFPYTTLFRSPEARVAEGLAAAATALMLNPKQHRARAMLLGVQQDRKSTRLNSSHVEISYAVFCLKKKKRANKKVR